MTIREAAEKALAIIEIVRDLRREVYGDRATRALIDRLSQITMT